MNFDIPNDFKLPHTLITWGQVKASLEEFFKKKIPSNIKDLSKRVAAKGWFLPFDDIDLLAIPDLAKKDDKEIENFLVEYYKNKADEIIESSKTVFPDRYKLFQSALNVHKQENYNASIPLLLAQADGVCVDMFGEKLFSKQKGKPKTANVVQKKVLDNYILEAVVEPLLSGSALTLNPNEMKEKRKDSNYSVLNRHEIMHGADKIYGSEINSLKAISLINYLMSLQRHS